MPFGSGSLSHVIDSPPVRGIVVGDCAVESKRPTWLSAISLRNPWVSTLIEARFPCPNDGLCPVSNLQFAEDVGDVVGDGFQAEGQTTGDVAIVVALGDQRQDLAFAVGEFGKELRQNERAGSGEEVDQALGNGRAEDGFATACSVDGAQEPRAPARRAAKTEWSSSNIVTTRTRMCGLV